MELEIMNNLKLDLINMLNNFYKNNFNCYNQAHLDLQIRFNELNRLYDDLLKRYHDDKLAFLQFKNWWLGKKLHNDSRDDNIYDNEIYKTLIKNDENVNAFNVNYDNDSAIIDNTLSKPLMLSNNYSPSSSASSSTTLVHSSPNNTPESKNNKKRNSNLELATPKKAKWDSDDDLTPSKYKYKDCVNTLSSSDFNKALKNMRKKSSEHENPYRFKGKGRYSTSIPKSIDSESINKLYPINPAHNNGVNFKYNETVRNKHQRQHMIGGDCMCCKDFWDSVHLPFDNNHFNDNLERKRWDIQQHKNISSKHRSHFPRSRTPPGYW